MVLDGLMHANKLENINYLSKSDLDILDSFNETDYHLVYDDVLDAFIDNLVRCPDKILVSCGDRSYTYAEGAFIVDKIVKRLVDLGVGSQDCVAFLVDRSEWYLFNSLAVLSMGAIYVPLDDKLPDERVEFMLKDTKSKVLIANDATYGRALDVGKDCIILNISDIVDEDIGSLTRLDTSYGNLACILILVEVLVFLKV